MRRQLVPALMTASLMLATVSCGNSSESAPAEDPTALATELINRYGAAVFERDQQALGELLISPIGYAMIGRLAPQKYQGVMMGAWMMVTGLASLFAADFSGLVAQPADGSPLTSNPAYATLFTQLGVGSLVVGVVLVALVPWLSRLIGPVNPPKQSG